MATGIRNINPESTASVLDQIPHFADGPDGYVTVSEGELGAIKAFIQGEFDAEAAAEALETLTAREDLADAATRGLDDDADIDLSELIGFRRTSGAVQRVTPVRLTANEEGDGILLIMGSLKVAGTQEGKTLTVGGLSCNIAEDYNLETKKTSKGEIHFHTLDLTDEDSGSIFRTALYVNQGLEPAAVKLALKAGSPLQEILSGPGSGGGMGGAVNLRDVVTEEQIPWRADITEVRQYDSESEFALDGKSYSAALADGLVVWMRGEAEKKLHQNFQKIRDDLAAGKTWTLKVTNLMRDGDRVRMRTGLESSSAGSFFQEMLAAANEPKAELPAAAEAAEEAPANDVKAAPKARSNVFAKKKAAA